MLQPGCFYLYENVMTIVHLEDTKQSIRYFRKLHQILSMIKSAGIKIRTFSKSEPKTSTEALKQQQYSVKAADTSTVMIMFAQRMEW